MLLSLPRQARRNLETDKHDGGGGGRGRQPDGSRGRALVDQGLQRLGENNRDVASVDLAEREESIRPTLQRKEMREREIFCALENQFHIHLEKSPFLIHLLGKP